MVSVTLSVPDEIKRKMELHDEVNWSGFIRKRLIERIGELEGWEKWAKEEKGINDWSVKLQHKSRRGRFEELKKKGLV